MIHMQAHFHTSSLAVHKWSVARRTFLRTLDSHRFIVSLSTQHNNAIERNVSMQMAPRAIFSIKVKLFSGKIKLICKLLSFATICLAVQMICSLAKCPKELTLFQRILSDFWSMLLHQPVHSEVIVQNFLKNCDNKFLVSKTLLHLSVLFVSMLCVCPAK